MTSRGLTKGESQNMRTSRLTAVDDVPDLNADHDLIFRVSPCEADAVDGIPHGLQVFRHDHLDLPAPTARVLALRPLHVRSGPDLTENASL